MNGYDLKLRNLVSTWFSLFFLILLAFYLGYIEFFLNTQSKFEEKNPFERLIREDILENINTLKFKNRIGSFTIQKENNAWILKQPRKVPANSKTIQKIIKELQNIKVQTIHQNEPINYQSFSLDKPIMEIDLTTKLDEKKQIKVGLINPINNTSYLTVSGHKYIFQTNLFEESLERLELSDFIDSQIFSMPSHAITSFKLYQGKNKQPFIELKYLADNWTTQKYKVISNINTDKKINSILNVKPHMILDRQDEKLKNFIDNYLKNPRYKIVIKLKNNQIKTYEISYITRAIKDLKIEKKQYFIMRASDRTYPYIVHKSHLSKFTIRYSDLKN